MPRLTDIVHVLQSHSGRYECLDAFVDDIEELATQRLGSEVRVMNSGPEPTVEAWVDGQRLSIQIFSDQGIARFRLLDAAPTPPPEETMGLAAALGGVLGAAVGAASNKKEGLLGGLVLGVLVGGLLGAASQRVPAERALALQFDPVTSSWMLYDGPLLVWAKRTLIPASVGHEGVAS